MHHRWIFYVLRPRQCLHTQYIIHSHSASDSGIFYFQYFPIPPHTSDYRMFVHILRREHFSYCIVRSSFKSVAKGSIECIFRCWPPSIHIFEANRYIAATHHLVLLCSVRVHIALGEWAQQYRQNKSILLFGQRHCTILYTFIRWKKNRNARIRHKHYIIGLQPKTYCWIVE